MSVNRQIQTLHIRAAEQRTALAELKQLAVDIERCQETITSVLAELSSANQKFQGQRATREEVEYLTILLACAKKKLAWEKQITSLQKRAPVLMESMSRIMNERDFPPTEELKAEILHSLDAIRSALARLQVPEAGE